MKTWLDIAAAYEKAAAYSQYLSGYWGAEEAGFAYSADASQRLAYARLCRLLADTGIPVPEDIQTRPLPYYPDDPKTD